MTPSAGLLANAVFATETQFPWSDSNNTSEWLLGCEMGVNLLTAEVKGHCARMSLKQRQKHQFVQFVIF